MMKTRLLIIVGMFVFPFIITQAFAFGAAPYPPDTTIMFQKPSPFSITEMGEQITIQKTVSNPFSNQETQIELEFFIFDNQKENPELIGKLHDVTNFTSQIYQQNYTVEKSGRFFISVELTYLYDERYNETISRKLMVVDKISKAFETGRCKGELEHLFKPDYGSVVCVSDPSKPKLLDRGWIVG